MRYLVGVMLVGVVWMQGGVCVSVDFVGCIVMDRIQEMWIMRIVQIVLLIEFVLLKLYGGMECVVFYIIEVFVDFGYDVMLFVSGDLMMWVKFEFVWLCVLWFDLLICDWVVLYMLLMEMVVCCVKDFDVFYFYMDYYLFLVFNWQEMFYVMMLYGWFDLFEQ